MRDRRRSRRLGNELQAIDGRLGRIARCWGQKEKTIWQKVGMGEGLQGPDLRHILEGEFGHDTWLSSLNMDYSHSLSGHVQGAWGEVSSQARGEDNVSIKRLVTNTFV